MKTLNTSVLVNALLEEIESAGERQKKSKVLLVFLLSQSFKLNSPRIVLVEVFSVIRRVTGGKECEDASEELERRIEELKRSC
ncbi:hypothetical protein DRP04_00345 [Archaeoglobales archaeon]|nr:MAG: hypothetical protein DRP04_00345 [Archaeoglobales archaeon]